MNASPIPPDAVNARWISIADAAVVLGSSEVYLRRACDRASRRGRDGAIEASVDGMRARKLGRLWRLELGAWSTGAS